MANCYLCRQPREICDDEFRKGGALSKLFARGARLVIKYSACLPQRPVKTLRVRLKPIQGRSLVGRRRPRALHALSSHAWPCTQVCCKNACGSARVLQIPYSRRFSEGRP